MAEKASSKQSRLYPLPYGVANEDEDFLCESLHIAARNGYCKTFRMLIALGKPVNDVDDDGNTVLHSAAVGGAKAIVKNLLSLGLSINEKNLVGNSPLDLAVEAGQWEAVKTMLFDNSLSEDDISQHLTTLINKFIQSGSDVNVQDSYHTSALHVVARGNRDDLVEMLINNNADLNLTDDRGQTALHLSISYRRWRAADSLILMGADLDAQCFVGRTPLHYIVWNCNYEMCQKVLNKGASIDLADISGETPYQLSSFLLISDKPVRYLYISDPENDMLQPYYLTKYCIWKQMIKLQIAGIPVDFTLAPGLNVPFPRYVTDGDKFAIRFAMRCKQELEKIKSTEVIDGVSFNVVISTPEDPVYLENLVLLEALEKALSLQSFERKFPLYCGVLRNLFHKQKKILQSKKEK